MKKFFSLILALCLAVTLAACGTGAAGDDLSMRFSPTGAASPLAASRGAVPFTDVPAGSGYADAVAWCWENGIMNGTAETTFSPDETLTRAMLATVLYRAEGEPAVSTSPGFTDTQAGTWYSNAVVWADANSLMQGYGGGLFGTNDPVTREQLAAILWRYDGEKEAETVTFPDDSSISGYARTAMDWAVRGGVLAARTDGSAAPSEPAIRSEIASAFYAYLSDRMKTPAQPSASTAPSTDDPVVYMTTDISSDGLMAIYEALEASPEGRIAVKLSTGEPGSNYLRTDLIGGLVQSLDAAIVECNTAYGGSRANTAMHKQVAADHGYTAIATVDIMDEEAHLIKKRCFGWVLLSCLKAETPPNPY